MKIYSIILVALSLLIASCNTTPDKKFVLEGEAQGSYYAITYYDSLGRDLGREIDSLLDDFDQSCSNYQ